MIRKKAAVPFLALASVLFLASLVCQGEHAEDEIIRRLTKDDSGREHEIRVEERFEVALPEVPTSGYVWTVYRVDPAYLRLEREGYAEPDDKEGRVGGRRTKLFVFLALQEGRTGLELRLRRPWEDEDKHIESFEVTLNIVSL